MLEWLDGDVRGRHPVPFDSDGSSAPTFVIGSVGIGFSY